MKHSSFLVWVFLGVLAGSHGAQAATILVTTTSENGEPAQLSIFERCLLKKGTCSLRNAITLTNGLPGADTIKLKSLVYHLSKAGTDEDQNVKGDLDITDDLTIEGNLGFTNTVIDGHGLDRVLDVHAEAFTLNKVHVINGHAINPDGSGGGLRVNRDDYAVITVNHSLFKNNTADYAGGAIETGLQTVLLLNSTHFEANTGWQAGAILNSGFLELKDCHFTGNHATDGNGGAIRNGYDSLDISGGSFKNNQANAHGGAIYADAGADGNVTVFKTLFENNQARDNGGAIAFTKNAEGFESAYLSIADATFHKNRSTEALGGALFVQDQDASLRDVTLSENSAPFGGAIANFGTLSLKNSTLSGNETTGAGGALMNSGGAVDLTFVTFANNKAPSGFGAAIYNEQQGVVRFQNTLVGKHTGKACYSAFGTLMSDGHNLEATNSCNFKLNLNDLISKDPQLGALANNGGPTKTHSLAFTSPARNKGVVVPGFPQDQRGFPRLVGAAPDIGALEIFTLTVPTPED